MTDLEYTTSGMFTAFIPNTTAGEQAWRAIAEQTEGTGKILTFHLKATLRQLRAAGYTVKKAKPVPVDINALMAELETAGVA